MTSQLFHQPLQPLMNTHTYVRKVIVVDHRLYMQQISGSGSMSFTYSKDSDGRTEIDVYRETLLLVRVGNRAAWINELICCKAAAYSQFAY